MYLCHHFIFSHGFFYSKWWQAAALTLFFSCMRFLAHSANYQRMFTSLQVIASCPVSFFPKLYLPLTKCMGVWTTENCSCYMSACRFQFIWSLTDLLWYILRIRRNLVPPLQLQLRHLLLRGTVAAACQTFLVACSKTLLLNTGPICLTSTAKYVQVNKRLRRSAIIFQQNWLLYGWFISLFL